MDVPVHEREEWANGTHVQRVYAFSTIAPRREEPAPLEPAEVVRAAALFHAKRSADRVRGLRSAPP